MRASDFDLLFRQHVVEPTATVGFEPWGKALWFERDGLRAALLRTELRSTWPFEYTLVVSHDCVRDFQDRAPAPRTRELYNWPVKIRPSRARDLLAGWCYDPSSVLRAPRDEMTDQKAAKELDAIGRALLHTFPRVMAVLTPEKMHEQLVRYGEDAWCERRWIEDYRHAVAGSTDVAPET